MKQVIKKQYTLDIQTLLTIINTNSFFNQTFNIQNKGHTKNQWVVLIDWYSLLYIPEKFTEITNAVGHKKFIHTDLNVLSKFSNLHWL